MNVAIVGSQMLDWPAERYHPVMLDVRRFVRELPADDVVLSGSGFGVWIAATTNPPRKSIDFIPNYKRDLYEASRIRAEKMVAAADVVHVWSDGIDPAVALLTDVARAAGKPIVVHDISASALALTGAA